MPLQSLFTGETAGTSAALNNNFGFLEQQIIAMQAVLGITPGGSGAAGLATATGSSAVVGRGFQQAGSVATATGTNTTSATSASLTSSSAVAAATGTELDSYRSIANTASVATASGNSAAQSFIGSTYVGAATGTSSTSFIGSSTMRSVAAAIGGSTAAVLSIQTDSSVGAATGSSTTQATNGSVMQTESADQTVVSVPAQQMFASATPGSASNNLNTFGLTASPGTVVFNGVNDTTQTSATELVYSQHTVFLQTTGNNWLRWVSANNWAPATSPLPAPPAAESVEGFTVTTTNTLMYAASAANGTAASATATPGNGLDTWALTANPGQLIHNGAVDTNTGAVTRLVYHNNRMWQFGGGNWYVWTIPAGPANGYTQGGTGGFATTPFPTTPAINIAKIPDQNINTTFVVSGTYQDYTTGGAATNLIANSSNQAAAAGSPGVLPTNWSSNLVGLTQTLAGPATDPTVNLSALNWTISGTPNARSASMSFGNVPVSASSTYTLSVYFALTSGALTNIPFIALGWNEFNSTGTLVANPINTDVTAVNSTIARYTMTATTSATTTSITPYFTPMFIPTVTPGFGSFTVGGHRYQIDAAKNSIVDGVAIANGAATATILYVTSKIYMQDSNNGNWFTWTSAGGFDPGPIAAPNTTLSALSGTPPNFRIAGAQVNAGSSALTFQSTPVATGLPVLNYQDNSTGNWLSFSSNANVQSDTTNTVIWSFVHPPVPTVSGSFTVGVRDSVQTGIAQLSNVFKTVNPGVTTIGAITLNGLASNSSVTISGNQPAGTVVGQLAVSTSPGSFSGQIITTGTNALKFTVNSSYQLVTAAVLGAGSFPIGLQATQNGAAGSPQTANFTVVVSAEATNGFSVNTLGGTVVGSSTPGTAGAQLTWVLVNAQTAGTTNFQFTLSVNGGAAVLQPFSNAVSQLYYVNHSLYQVNANGSWFVFNGTITNGISQFVSSASPIPVITLTNVEQGTGLTGDDGQVSTVGAGGVATDSFIPTPASTQLFSIQMFVAGVALPYASGPTNYAITGGNNASSFTVINTGTGWFLNGSGAIPAGTYAVTLSATY